MCAFALSSSCFHNRRLCLIGSPASGCAVMLLLLVVFAKIQVNVREKNLLLRLAVVSRRFCFMVTWPPFIDVAPTINHH